MRNMFSFTPNFNQDIGSWNLIAVTDVTSMFEGAQVFNMNIGEWNVSNAINMARMFNGSKNFNQDLGLWCVYQLFTEPSGFSTNSALSTENHPVWGTCP
jgi:hypothetical protein